MTSRELAVFAYLPGEATAVPAGLLTLEEEGTTPKGAAFVYGLRYLDRPNAIEIDPVSLGLRNKEAVRGVVLHPVPGLTLFGAIRDAAPDAWGRRVIEARRKVPQNSLPESDYLLAAGANRVGALDVRTGLDVSEAAGVPGNIHKLDYFLEAARRIEAGLPVPARLAAFFDAGSSLGGARPKATVADAKGKLWLAKFPSQSDGYDVPSWKRHAQARGRGGLTVPRIDMIELGAGQPILLIDRFDRVGVANAMTRRHFISALTLVGCPEQDSPQKLRRHCGCPAPPRRRPALARTWKAIRPMVFSILVTNDDDHLQPWVAVGTRGTGMGIEPAL
jgi:serine/threonine-protein kinase HipA